MQFGRFPSVLTMLLITLPTVSFAQDQRREDRFAAIPKRMQEFIDREELSGVVTLVAQRGQIVHLAATGMADVEKQRPLTPDSMFRIMSMTKPFTATAVMMLADEGKLSLDDPVEKYIPSFANSMLRDGTMVKDLTIRRLLTHTSGLGGDQNTPFSLEATAEMLAQRAFDFQPGERWQYGPSLNVCAGLWRMSPARSTRIFWPSASFSRWR